MPMSSFCDMSQAGAPFRFDTVCVLDFPTSNALWRKGNKRADKKECFGSSQNAIYRTASRGQQDARRKGTL